MLGLSAGQSFGGATFLDSASKGQAIVFFLLFLDRFIVIVFFVFIGKARADCFCGGPGVLGRALRMSPGCAA